MLIAVLTNSIPNQRVFELEGSNTRRVKNLNRSILIVYKDLNFEQQRSSWAL